jgi:hypothetical protein
MASRFGQKVVEFKNLCRESKQLLVEKHLFLTEFMASLASVGRERKFCYEKKNRATACVGVVGAVSPQMEA